MALTNTKAEKEIEWWDFRWGFNAEMLAHFEEISKDGYFDEQDHFGDVYLKRRTLIVGGTKKIMVAFGSFSWASEQPEPNWMDYTGALESIKIKTDEESMFTPPYEMENIASLVLFTWLNLDGNKPRILDGAERQNYQITGNLAPTPQELWGMLQETFTATPKRRKWWDYHIR